jgi:hypothetical protein
VHGAAFDVMGIQRSVGRLIVTPTFNLLRAGRLEAKKMAHATIVQPASKGEMHKHLSIYVPVKL